jgi:aminobenzoyl-glutamate transport protein
MEAAEGRFDSGATAHYYPCRFPSPWADFPAKGMITVEQEKQGPVLRLLHYMERAGNRLPDPITLFLIMIGVVMITSVVAVIAQWTAIHPGTGAIIEPVNLFGGPQIRRTFVEMAQTFATFPPLGLVLLVMLGIGVAERSGLIKTALRAFVSAVPPGLISGAIVFAGMMSSMAVDAGYVVLIPLGAVIFYGMGRHPMVGLAAAFAGVSAGFSANLLITGLDVLLVSFTEPAAHLYNPEYTVLFTSNWYLMAALVPVFTVAGTWVTERVVEPAMGSYDPADAEEGLPAPDSEEERLTDDEQRGLAAAGWAVIVTTVLAVLLVVPTPWWTPPLYEPGGTFFLERIGPFLSSLVALMLFFFFIPGLVYGVVTKSIRSDADAARMTAETMSSMGAYIVLAFVAAHLVAFFSWSNLGLIVSVAGADGLQAIGFVGIPLIVAFVVVSSLMNLLIGSASAKWAIMGPIFVPMLMQLGYSPELTQAAYRIGDSVTNVLTPLLPYFPLVIIFARKYDRKVGIGTILSAMLPYSVVFFIAGILTLIAWMLLGLPLGPGASLHYTA